MKYFNILQGVVFFSTTLCLVDFPFVLGLYSLVFNYPFDFELFWLTILMLLSFLYV